MLSPIKTIGLCALFSLAGCDDDTQDAFAGPSLGDHGDSALVDSTVGADDAGGLMPDAADEDASPPPDNESLGAFAARTCFIEGDETPRALIDGLALQLVEGIDCIRPGALSNLPDGNWAPYDPARRMLVDARGLDDLLAAAASGDAPMVIKWAYRDVAIQHLFYLWTQTGCDFAAPPGLSNHQNGLSVDLIDPGEWVQAMARQGWGNNLPTDRPHFDYELVPDQGMATLSLLAFQATWNRNHPEALLPLTGEFDAATEQALTDAPLAGFEVGLCDDGAAPPELPELRGPSVAQSAWRGCGVPPDLIEGLGAQVAEVMRCIAPEHFVPLSLCADAGCVAVIGDPKPEFLGAPAHGALIEASQSLGRPLTVDWAFRDVSVAHHLFSTHENLSCPAAGSAAQSVFVTGAAVQVPDSEREALLAAGFEASGDVMVWPGALDLRPLAVFAFQSLWNANRPASDRLTADGLVGPATLSAIDRAPIGGFSDSLSGACADLEPPPLSPFVSICVEGCFNQGCPGTYDFCTVEHGACAEVPCAQDADCDGLGACDDPSSNAPRAFMCDDGRCRRQR